ncbi:hypothetical protein QFZ58_006822 [Streptomyces sp. B1I3]|nr:hypothetical protein [Streptomyces sp. B1I3]
MRELRPLGELRGCTEGGLGKDPERAATRAAQLTAIDPDWDCPWPLDWQRHYRVLADLVDADGILPYIAPGVIFEGDDIGRWLQRQKNPGTWTQLLPEQQQRLSKPGVHPARASSPAPATARATKGPSKAQQAFQRGLAALAQWVEREGADRPVPRGHGEEIAVDGEAEPVTVKLGVWISQASRPAAVRIRSPRARNVQLTVHRRVPAAACIDKVDRGLRVFDPAGSAGVLALDTDGVHALLHVPGLVDHQHRILIVQMLQHVLTHVITHTIGIPPGPAEQVLHAVRTRLPGPLGDRPAVLARQARQQSQHQVLYAAPGFNPREPARYLAHQGLERLLPAGRVHAAARGHRITLKSPHTSSRSRGGCPVPAANDEITESCWH